MSPTVPDDYAERLAGAHGVEGFAVTPDGGVVYAAYRDGSYDLVLDGDRLTDTEGDLTAPQWLDGRGTLLALHDEGGAERHDVVEVDPDDGEVRPVTDDDHDDIMVRPSPTDPDRLAFVSTRHGSLDAYTMRFGDDEPTRQSETDRIVYGLDWSPDGDALVYQAGLTEGSALRLATEAGDETLVDEPDSEQAFGMAGGRGAWSHGGIVFTTNHESGYRDVAVTDADGDVEVRYGGERDAFDARWTPDGDVLLFESRDGDLALRRLADGDAETVHEAGMNGLAKPADDGPYYVHHGPDTAGDLYRDGEAVVEEGRVDVPTTAPDRVRYESFDGLEIPSLHYRPDGEPRGAVVKAHGGPEGEHRNVLDPATQTLVTRGFEVLAPNVRGSTGYGREFRKLSDGDLGGDDLRDLVAATEYLRDHGIDDVGVTGGSYGGYMTLMGVAATDAFDAGASVCGVANWVSQVENARGFVADELQRKLGGRPDERPEFYAERSPINHVDDIDVPLLVVQGANDPRVPPSEAEQIVDSLDERGVAHDYLLFEDEGHGVTRTGNRVEYVDRVASFFGTHLGGE